MIEPGRIPQFTGDLAAIEAAAARLSSLAGTIAGRGAHAASTFRDLGAFYRAPEAPELVGSINPVGAAADALGHDVSAVSAALSEFVAEAQPIVDRLRMLRADAQAFVAGVQGDDHWTDDPAKVAYNNDLVYEVDAAIAQFRAVEAAAANKIQRRYGGPPFPADGTGAGASVFDDMRKALVGKVVPPSTMGPAGYGAWGVGVGLSVFGPTATWMTRVRYGRYAPRAAGRFTSPDASWYKTAYRG
ncbi:MAG TPA: hypothetical protein VF069_19700, partial [Streptosporangiaceae bacterium]